MSFLLFLKGMIDFDLLSDFNNLKFNERICGL